MAWRPNEQIIEGVLDNTSPNKITGWMLFAGMKEKVVFELEGNFHRDIRGAKVRLRGDGELADAAQAKEYMEDFSTIQKGKPKWVDLFPISNMLKLSKAIGEGLTISIVLSENDNLLPS